MIRSRLYRVPVRSLHLLGSLAFALLPLLHSAQESSPFSFRMVFTHQATDSAYAAEHLPHLTFEERAAKP